MIDKALIADNLQLKNRALHAFRSGQFEQARTLFEKVGLRNKMDADTWIMLGRSCEALKDLSCAKKAYEQASRLRPSDPQAHFDLARVLHKANLLKEAEIAYRSATALKSDFAEANYFLGTLLLARGKEQEALIEYQRVLDILPNSPQAHFNLAYLLKRLGSHEESVIHYRESLRLNPNQPETLVNLSGALLSLGRAQEAEEICRQAVQLDPRGAITLYNHAKALAAIGRLEEAASAFEKSSLIDPEINRHLAEAVSNQDPDYLGTRTHVGFDASTLYARFQLGRLDRCDWEGLATFRSWSREFIEQGVEIGEPIPIGPLAAQCLGVSPSLLLRLNKAIASGHEYKAASEGVAFRPGLSVRPCSPIRIGYVSADFGTHNHFHLIRNLLATHDRAEFQIIGYSLFNPGNSIDRDHARHSCDHFRELEGLTDLDAAGQINSDGIQILVDLNGYSRHGRPRIFTLRPAPLQVHYPIGCPSTMGANFIDYMIVDRVLVPPELESFCSEQLVFLPEGYQGEDYLQPITKEPWVRSDQGLPLEGFVYCCLTDNQKIDPEIFDLWMAILREVEGSVLWIFPTRPEVPAHLRKEAAARGVNPDRLIFMQRMAKSHHLARQLLADLFLDTPHLSAHTTAVDALWVGLPLLTCPQQTLGSRVGASLLTSAGLPELIAADLMDYKARAIQLATDPKEYASIRKKVSLARVGSPLFSTRRRVRHLEQSFRLMWARYQSGQPPISFEVPILED